jgi:uncharacterized delta-60 repeat protein
MGCELMSRPRRTALGMIVLSMTIVWTGCETSTIDRTKSRPKALSTPTISVIEEQSLTIESGQAQEITVGRTKVKVPDNYLDRSIERRIEVKIRRVTVPTDVDEQTAVSLGQAEEVVEFETVDVSTRQRITSDQILAPIEISQTLTSNRDDIAMLVLLADEEGDASLNLAGGFSYGNAQQFAVRKPALQVEVSRGSTVARARLQEASFLIATVQADGIPSSVDDYPAFDQNSGVITRRARSESTVDSGTGTSGGSSTAGQTNGGDTAGGTSSSNGGGSSTPNFVNITGNIDQSFGTMGTVVFGNHFTVSGVPDEMATTLSFSSSGKILAGGSNSNRTGYWLAVLNEDGSADTSFADDGHWSTDDHPAGTTLNASAIDSNGRYLIAGIYPSSSDSIYVTRLTSIGGMDASFGTQGRVDLNADGGGNGDRLIAMVVGSNGKIYLAHTNPAQSIRVIALNDDGSLWNEFGVNGIRMVDSQAEANSMIMDGAGRLVLAGYENNTGSKNLAVWRLTATGSMDSSFGPSADGRFTWGQNGIGADEVGQSMTFDPDGKILVGGYRHDGSDDVQAVWKLGADGEGLDNSNFASPLGWRDYTGQSFLSCTAIAVDAMGNIFSFIAETATSPFVNSYDTNGAARAFFQVSQTQMSPWTGIPGHDVQNIDAMKMTVAPNGKIFLYGMLIETNGGLYSAIWKIK